MVIRKKLYMISVGEATSIQGFLAGNSTYSVGM